MAERKPFHEVIVTAIEQVGPSGEVVSLLCWLIKSTKIPKGHDEIIAAWKKRYPSITPDGEGTVCEVLADLLEQKREAEAEEQARMAKLAELRAKMP